MSDSWQKFYFAYILGSYKLFLRAFHNLTNQQLLQLRHKFEVLPDKQANAQEFPSTIILSHLLLQAAEGKDYIEYDNLKRYLLELADMVPMYYYQVRNLTLINREIDSFYQRFVDWSTFSNHVMQSSAHQKAASLTNYFNSYTAHYLTSSKVKDPIYSVNYSKECDCFLICLKDNLVVYVDKEGNILYKIKTQAMPVSAATFRPHIYDFNSYKFELKPYCGGYNTIISTTDRKLNIYSGTQLISSIPTDDMHTVIRTQDCVYYRRKIIQPAIFSGDNRGNVCFWKLSDYELDGDDEIGTTDLKVLVEEEDIDFSNQSDDEKSEQYEVNETANVGETIEAADIRRRFDEFKQYYELLQKSQSAALHYQLSPTPIWEINAHKDWVNDILIEYMDNSGQYILASGASDGSICTYDINTGQRAAVFTGHYNVKSLAWLHYRGLLVSVGADRRLNVYVPNSFYTKTSMPQLPIAYMPLADHAYVGVFAARHKPEFLTIDAVGTICQWDIRKMEPAFTVFGYSQRNGKTVCAAYADSGHLASGSAFLSIAHPQNAGQQLYISHAAIEAVAIAKTCPSIVLSAGETIYIWDLRSGCCASQIQGFVFSGKRKLRYKNTAIGMLSGRVDNSETVGLNVMQAMADPRSSDKTGRIDLVDNGFGADYPDYYEYRDYNVGDPMLGGYGSVETRREITALGLSPNGSIVAVATDDERIVLLSAHNHQLIWEFYSSKEEQKQLDNNFYEKYNYMQQMEDRYIKIRASLEYDDVALSLAEKHRKQTDGENDRTGVCTDVYFHEGSSYLGYWQCFREQRKVVTYKIIGKESHLVNARAQFRGTWQQTLFNHYFGQLVLRYDTELSIIMFDGAPLCKIYFNAKVRLADLCEDILVVVMQDSDTIFFIDYETINIFSWAVIPNISRAQSVKYAHNWDTVVFLSDDNTLVTYCLDMRSTYERFCKMKHTTNSIDVHIPLSRYQRVYEYQYVFSFNTRRYTFVVTELPEKQRDQFNPEAIVPFPTELHPQALQTITRADGLSLSDLCLLQVHYHELAGIFVVSTALGYALAVSAQSGQFIYFLTLNGWLYQAKSLVLHLQKKANSTRFLYRVMDEDSRNFEQAKLFSSDLAKTILGLEIPTREIENAQLRYRRKRSLSDLSKQFCQDVERFNAKKLQFAKTDANLTQSIRDGNERMAQYNAESINILRSKSQLASPVRKLPQIADDPAVALGRALSQAHAIKQATDYRWYREVRTVKNDFKNIEKKITEHKQTKLPTILNMTKAELIQRYRADKDGY